MLVSKLQIWVCIFAQQFNFFLFLWMGLALNSPDPFPTSSQRSCLIGLKLKAATQHVYTFSYLQRADTEQPEAAKPQAASVAGAHSLQHASTHAPLQNIPLGLD